MKRLLLLTTTPLEQDPRARRAAATAAAIGVEAIHIHEGRSGRATVLTAAARHFGVVGRELRGVARVARLLRTTARLALHARSLHFDVLHANDLDTLPAGWWLARRRGARLVYDAHELYSGFESEPPRVWARISLLTERALARRADAVVTVSQPIADELERRLRLAHPPLLVLNCPPQQEVVVEPRNSAPRVRAVYQAAVGPGRHIQDVVDAARDAPAVEVTVRLLGGDLSELPGIRVEPPVEPDELVSALAPYDIGLVIDRPETDNARLALPNKLFEYLMAGLAVAVPEAPAMARLVETHGIGIVYEPGQLGAALALLGSDRGTLDETRRRARALAVSSFNAEAQRPNLLRAWGL